jgi:hypothetical protein
MPCSGWVDRKVSQQVHEVQERFLDELSQIDGPPEDIAMLNARWMQGFRGGPRFMTMRDLSEEIIRRRRAVYERSREQADNIT